MNNDLPRRDPRRGGLVSLIFLLLGFAPAPPTMILRQGGAGPPVIILLHGYGSSAEHWAPFVPALAPPKSARFVFPQADGKMIRGDGMPGGRAWWPLDLGKRARPQSAGVDLSRDHPPGLIGAGERIATLVRTEGAAGETPPIVGGFSQGAMVAGQVAFTTGIPLSALVILSGTEINRAAWRQGMGARKGIRVFLAHGRDDRVLPFDRALRLRNDLVEAGLDVTFVPFAGGHEIPAEVVAALRVFLGWSSPDAAR